MSKLKILRLIHILFRLIDCASSRTEKVHEDATKPEETCLVGLCTGLFAAAAIASSPSLSALIPLAVQFALMAFRAGSHVAAMAERLHKDIESSETWTYVLPTISEEETTSIVDVFHKENVSIKSIGDIDVV